MTFSLYSGFFTLASRDGFAAALDRAEELGCRAIEVLEGNPYAPTLIPDVKTAKELRAMLQERGMSVACYSAGTTFDLTDPTRAAHETFVSALKNLLDIAAALGSPFFHHTNVLHLAKPEGWPSFEEALPRLLDAAEEVAHYAEGLGIVCLYEPQGYYVNGHERFPVFYSEMKKRAKNIGVCGDVGNILFAEGDPARFFCEFASEIPHAHIKDYKIANSPEGEGDWLRTQGGRYVCEVPTGEGDIDLASCLSSLACAGYSGAFSVETWIGEERMTEATEAVMRTVNAYFKR